MFTVSAAWTVRISVGPAGVEVLWSALTGMSTAATVATVAAAPTSTERGRDVIGFPDNRAS